MPSATSWRSLVGTSSTARSGSRLTRHGHGRPTSIHRCALPPLPTFLTDLAREPGAVQTLVASPPRTHRRRPRAACLLAGPRIDPVGRPRAAGDRGAADAGVHRGRRSAARRGRAGRCRWTEAGHDVRPRRHVVTGIGGVFVDGPLSSRSIRRRRQREHRPADRPGRRRDPLRGRRSSHRHRPRLRRLRSRHRCSPGPLDAVRPDGSRERAFVAAAGAAIIAFAYSRRHWDDLPTAGPSARARSSITAIWAFGIVVITAGLIGFQGKSADAARVALVLFGAALVVGGLFVERRWRRAGQPSSGSSVARSRSPCSSGSSSPTPRPPPSSRCRSTSSSSSATGRSCR